jgi:SAM-dependent methyltransferase
VTDIEQSDFRDYVGRRNEYDLNGASQFSLLCAMGLRQKHRLVDIGCGSLRGGRLFISYLNGGGYTGLEPNKWLVDAGIDEHLGREMLALKRPVFVHNESFDLSGVDPPFDYVLAQSVASHTGPAMTRSLLESVRTSLAPSGIAAITFHHGPQDTTTEGWIYSPEATGKSYTTYRRRTIERMISDSGLKGVPIPWFHERQVWWIVTHPGTPFPPRLLRLLARGAILPYRRSWDVPYRLWFDTSRKAWRAVRGKD